MAEEGVRASQFEAYPRGLRVVIGDRTDGLADALSSGAASAVVSGAVEASSSIGGTSSSPDWVARAASLIEAVAAALPTPEIT